MEDTEYAVVLVTAPDEAEAQKIAHALVEESLAACVNIVRNIRSIYRWQAKIEDESEVLMIIKTRKELFGQISARVSALHPYSVPECIAVPIVAGSDAYLGWLGQGTKGRS